MKKGVLRTFTKFTHRKTPRPATLLKKETLAQVFSCEFLRTFQNQLFYKTPLGDCCWISKEQYQPRNVYSSTQRPDDRFRKIWRNLRRKKLYRTNQDFDFFQKQFWLQRKCMSHSPISHNPIPQWKMRDSRAYSSRTDSSGFTSIVPVSFEQSNKGGSVFARLKLTH